MQRACQMPWSILPASALQQPLPHPGTQRGTRKPSLFWADSTKPRCHSSNSHFLQLGARAAAQLGLGSGPEKPRAEVNLVCGGSESLRPKQCTSGRTRSWQSPRLPSCHHQKLGWGAAGAGAEARLENTAAETELLGCLNLS